MKTKPPSIIKYKDLTIRLFKGKFGEYTYKSPMYGYKRAYKYNQALYIYLTGQPNWIDRILLKNANRKEILSRLDEFRDNSRKYKKARGI